MVVTIIEGGELARVLVRFLLLLGHKINLIKYKVEADDGILKESGVNLIQSDATDISILTEPCILQSDIVIALMDRDADNLLLSLSVKKHNSTTKTITRVSNSKYKSKYEKLGIDAAFDYTSVLSGLQEMVVQTDNDESIY
ncbi:MAG: hypothetical protein A2Y21_08485 [Clostridiales bacterium GWC2_40_7]|nr:MAG: hypothetical protein A2Y21_08485 [Clostridiales bacterium GWC2_40_7]